MTLQQLRYIIMVASKGTIIEAAKALFITQPSLSNAIKELEKEIHMTIFQRTNKGVNLTREGDEFLAYARQVIHQMDLLEAKYNSDTPVKQHFSISTQHYSFAVDAFVDLIHLYGEGKYDFHLRETQTYEIIEDVAKMRSELGILYLNDFNHDLLMRYLNTYDLSFTLLFTASPHVFVSSQNPLAKKETVDLQDLEDYPYLSFEQGEYNSFYFSEEILSVIERRKNIRVRDRATLFNLLIGLQGYTICSGIISEELNGKNICAIPLNVNENMRIGYIQHQRALLSPLAAYYITRLTYHTLDIDKAKKAADQ